jgi:6-phosphogluconate dehydrogenase
VIRSWLLDLVAGALAEEPDLASVAPWVPDSGAGRWAVLEALELDVPAPVLTLALLERLASREKDSFAHRLLATMRARFGGHAVRRKEG